MPEFIHPAVLELCVLLRDTVPSVRIRAAWALSVICCNMQATPSARGKDAEVDGDGDDAQPGVLASVFAQGSDVWSGDWHRRVARDTFLLRFLPVDTLILLSQTLCGAVYDTDKVSATVVRALGHCASALFIHARDAPVLPDATNPMEVTCAVSIISAITQCTSSLHVKVRGVGGNAPAIGVMLVSVSVFVSIPPAAALERVPRTVHNPAVGLHALSGCD